ncbi:MAG: ABC transporter ATP-binding protein [Myxococcales bacterium]
MLSVEDIHSYYGESHVLHGVSLTVNKGELVAILGRNGMGKTTLIRGLIGFTPPRQGRVVFKDRDVTSLPPFRAVEMGMGLVPQGRRIFPSLSVLENLKVAANGRSKGWSLDRVFSLFPRLAQRKAHAGDNLSGGEQQMLAIGRAMKGQPKILLLDEPSMGISPVLTERIYETIAAINQQGTTILLVEQNANFALEVSKRGYVLETGKVVMSDSSDALRTNPEVQKAYLGT